MTRLKELYLLDTPVTDAGLEHLPALVGLRILDLRRTGVTEAGLRDLRRKLPDVAVYR